MSFNKVAERARRDIEHDGMCDVGSLINEVDELHTLIYEIHPEMEARLAGLQKLHPGDVVNKALAYNSFLVNRIKKILGE